MVPVRAIDFMSPDEVLSESNFRFKLMDTLKEIVLELNSTFHVIDVMIQVRFSLV